MKKHITIKENRALLLINENTMMIVIEGFSNYSQSKAPTQLIPTGPLVI
jgi:hypothetical protein